MRLSAILSILIVCTISVWSADVGLGLSPVPISAGGAGTFSGLTVTGAAAFQGTTLGFFSTTPTTRQAITVDADTAMVNLGLKVAGAARCRALACPLLTLVNLNSANTDVATISNLPAKWRAGSILVFDASTSLTTCTFDLRTATGGGGSSVLNSGASALTGLTAATLVNNPTIVSTSYFTASTLTLRCVAAQGAPATASFLFSYTDFTP